MSGGTSLLKPDKLEIDPGLPAADVRYRHWKETFSNFLAAEADHARDNTKFKILVNNVSPTVYSYIRDTNCYSTAIGLLDKIYLKSHKNEIQARYLLSSTKQNPDETVEDYLRRLQQLASACNFRNVSAEEYRNEYVLDTFIAGLHSPHIREKLLHNKELSLEEACHQAVTIEEADKKSDDANHERWHPALRQTHNQDPNEAVNNMY